MRGFICQCGEWYENADENTTCKSCNQTGKFDREPAKTIKDLPCSDNEEFGCCNPDITNSPKPEIPHAIDVEDLQDIGKDWIESAKESAKEVEDMFKSETKAEFLEKFLIHFLDLGGKK